MFHLNVSSSCSDSGGTNFDEEKTKRKDMHLIVATYNPRTLMSEERPTEMEIELEKITWGIVGTSEVRRGGENLYIKELGHNTILAENKVQWVGLVYLKKNDRHKSNFLTADTN